MCTGRTENTNYVALLRLHRLVLGTPRSSDLGTLCQCGHDLQVVSTGPPAPRSSTIAAEATDAGEQGVSILEEAFLPQPLATEGGCGAQESMLLPAAGNSQ